MARRRPGQSAITTPRQDKDRVEINSGTEFGITLGTLIGMRVINENQRPKDYGNNTMDLYPRPSHADWTYLEKYGVKASSGGGRSSARETIGRVAAGAIAEKYLRLAHGIEIVAFVSSVGNEFLFPPTPTHPTLATNLEFLEMIETIDRETVDSFAPVRCPNEEASKRMEKLVADFRDRHDSIGGTVTCVIRNCPSGLGEPCFDKLEAMLAHAMLSIPATKAFEIGSGFGGCQMPGSIHNDPFIKAPVVPPLQLGAYMSTPRPRLTTKTNNSGGSRVGSRTGPQSTSPSGSSHRRRLAKRSRRRRTARRMGCWKQKAGTTLAWFFAECPSWRLAALTIIDSLLARQARQTARSLLLPLKRTVPAEQTVVEKAERNSNGVEGTNGA